MPGDVGIYTRVRGGISISQLVSGTIPEPTHTLKWGEDMPAHVVKALENGETALLHDEAGNPYSLVLKDYFGTIREQKL